MVFGKKVDRMRWFSFKTSFFHWMGWMTLCGVAIGQNLGAEEGNSLPAVSKKDGTARKSSPGSLETPLVSGRAVGELVPSFYTRAITGPLMNRSVCYVCRNGERPVVMVFVRKLSPNLAPLFKQVDTLVDEHRAEGLRSFAVHISQNPSAAISEVQTFSFDHKIGLPLTVSPLAIADPDCQNLHAEAEVTVVLYQNRKVVSRQAFRAGEIPASEIESVAKSIRNLLKPGSEAGDQRSGKANDQ